MSALLRPKTKNSNQVSNKHTLKHIKGNDVPELRISMFAIQHDDEFGIIKIFTKVKYAAES